MGTETTKRFLVLAVLLAAACGQLRETAVTPIRAPLVYPPATRGDVVDVLHGVAVPDPYRWLEDANAAETRAWIEAQNEVTFGWLGQVAERRALHARLTELWNYERWGVPRREGGRLFATRNDGLQNQAVLCVIDRDGAEPRVLLDPNLLAADGTIALADWSVSRDGSLLAYALSTAGSDWRTWRVRDVETGLDLPDVIEWAKSSGADWLPDGSGFYYARFDKPAEGKEFAGANEFQKLCFHRMGTPQSADPVVYERTDHGDWRFGCTPTEDGVFLVVSVSAAKQRHNLVLYRNLATPGAPFTELIPTFEARYTFLGNDGPVLWFRTDLGAPMQRIVAIDTRRPEKSAWRTIVPEAGERIASASVVGGHLLVSYLRDAHSVVKSFSADGVLEREVRLPGLGTTRGFDGKNTDRDTYFSHTSYTSPPSIWRYDVDSGATTPFRQARTAFDATRYVTEQVFFSSRDGTRVPMFLTHRRDLARDGTNPTYLYGYGGFDISLTPSFSPATALWLEMGGIHAVANLRGGGEYGEAWHEAGTKGKKQNVFDDFIAAAEWLISERYTSTSKLAIAGGSNGGLLVGACMTQRPDLFGACLPAVGVMDMLRFHKFTVGAGWQSDYGSPDDAADFAALRRYSPYHNLKPDCYPPTLVTTADHDDRVVPGHSFKFAAGLQAAQQCANPVLIRIQTKAGHGAGKPTSKIIDEAADQDAFLVRALGIELPEGFGR